MLLSGANRGIGKAVALQLYRDGYFLSLGARDIDKLSVITEETEEERVFVHYYDAKNRNSARDWVSETISHFGQIDVVINNAGIFLPTSLEDDSEEALDELWEVNVKGPLRLTREALKYLRKSKQGMVINMVSLSGKRVKGKSLGYAMSKFALMALTHTTRFYGWDDGIRATAICPGRVNTDMVAGLNIANKNEIIQPQDLARLISLIISLPNNASIPELSINCVLE